MTAGTWQTTSTSGYTFSHVSLEYGISVFRHIFTIVLLLSASPSRHAWCFEITDWLHLEHLDVCQATLVDMYQGALQRDAGRRCACDAGRVMNPPDRLGKMNCL